ncbi:MAG: leucyl aminopeptidase, partial [Gammaproteobacteria bacterium]
MEFKAKTDDPAAIASRCLVIGVRKAKKPELTPSGARLDRACKKQLSAALSRSGMQGALGEIEMLYDVPGIKAERVLLVGLGANVTASTARLAARAAIQRLDKRGIRAADLCLPDALDAGHDEHDNTATRRHARHLAEACADALYRFEQTKSGAKTPAKLTDIGLLCAREQHAAVARGLREGAAVARGIRLARDLANLPGNVCTPSYLAKQAKQLAKRHELKALILNEAEMKRHGMGALLSVSRGSREPAKLIVLEYHGGKPGAPPLALVGKGLTFDAGGISLKPAAAMDEMKYDMCGGASVLGALQAAAELRLKINLVGIVPSSENMPDGAANKPGDIVTSMSGATIEVLNTDAEGRLILCDALTFAERYQPAAVVDIATLTGACAIALGDQASGLFSDCDALADELLAAGEASGDRAWRMPVWDEYDKQLHSNFADIANIGGRTAGAITAA